MAVAKKKQRPLVDRKERARIRHLRKADAMMQDMQDSVAGVNRKKKK
jgi:hypothetical protein